MEVFEVINKILDDKRLSKREFAQKLIELEPKSNRTGETISESIVYSYLTGKTAIKSFLIPYIAEVLDIPEQLLFEDTPKVRRRLIQYLASNLTSEEKYYLNTTINNNSNIGIQNIICELIQYAPEPMLKKIEQSLLDIKDMTKKI